MCTSTREQTKISLHFSAKSFRKLKFSVFRDNDRTGVLLPPEMKKHLMALQSRL
jgi:hypothetical protein